MGGGEGTGRLVNNIGFSFCIWYSYYAMVVYASIWLSARVFFSLFLFFRDLRAISLEHDQLAVFGFFSILWLDTRLFFSLKREYLARITWPRRSNFLTIVCQSIVANALVLRLFFILFSSSIEARAIEKKSERAFDRASLTWWAGPTMLKSNSRAFSLFFFSWWDQVDMIATHWSIVRQTIKMRKELRLFSALEKKSALNSEPRRKNRALRMEHKRAREARKNWSESDMRALSSSIRRSMRRIELNSKTLPRLQWFDSSKIKRGIVNFYSRCYLI